MGMPPAFQLSNTAFRTFSDAPCLRRSTRPFGLVSKLVRDIWITRMTTLSGSPAFTIFTTPVLVRALSGTSWAKAVAHKAANRISVRMATDRTRDIFPPPHRLMGGCRHQGERLNAAVLHRKSDWPDSIVKRLPALAW